MIQIFIINTHMSIYSNYDISIGYNVNIDHAMNIGCITNINYNIYINYAINNYILTIYNTSISYIIMTTCMVILYELQLLYIL